MQFCLLWKTNATATLVRAQLAVGDVVDQARIAVLSQSRADVNAEPPVQDLEIL